ncbi:hypothetical protein V7798_20395 [Rhizobium laguerreae]|nr:hypothetical protein [Rhizobium leguminosarum]
MAGRVSMGVRFNGSHIVMAWTREDPTTSRDDVIDIARSLVPPAR